MSTPRRRALGGTGFTLIEVLVSTTLVILLLLILVNITNQTGRIWKYTSGKVEQFREAREAFESMTRRLSQATLNTYWDYDPPPPNTPTRYIRKSELRFQSGPWTTVDPGASAAALTDHPTHAIFFQAPLGFATTPSDYPGLGNLLNTCGYYIQYGADLNRPPFLVSINSATRNRYRLMEYMQPTEQLNIYTAPSDWLKDLKQSPALNARSIAENIVALVIRPKLSAQDGITNGDNLTTNYIYDSTTNGPPGADSNHNTLNQLPPEVQVTMIAIDESSAGLIANLRGSSNPALVDPLWFGTDGVAKYSDDLNSLQQKFTTKPTINYRVFSTNVRIRGAKWSRQ